MESGTSNLWVFYLEIGDRSRTPVLEGSEYCGDDPQEPYGSSSHRMHLQGLN